VGKVGKIFCDIDNTVLDQYSEMKKYFDIKKKEFDLKSFNKRNLLDDKPIPKSSDAIKKLSKFYEIVWLSARNTNLYTITETWLRRNDFVIDDIVLVESHNKKIDVLKGSNCYAFIDDLKFNYEILKPEPYDEANKKVRSVQNSIFCLQR